MRTRREAAWALLALDGACYELGFLEVVDQLRRVTLADAESLGEVRRALGAGFEGSKRRQPVCARPDSDDLALIDPRIGYLTVETRGDELERLEKTSLVVS